METQEDRGSISRERAARNQSLFRSINERLGGLGRSVAMVSETATFVCECADLGCIATIDLTVGEYEAIRADSNEFFVLPEHVYPEAERVVAESDEHVVVAKIGEAGVTAQALDPRA